MGWRDVRKDLNINYKRLKALCVHGEGGTLRFSAFAESVCCLAVHVYVLCVLYVHAAKGGIA